MGKWMSECVAVRWHSSRNTLKLLQTGAKTVTYTTLIFNSDGACQCVSFRRCYGAPFLKGAILVSSQSTPTGARVFKSVWFLYKLVLTSIYLCSCYWTLIVFIACELSCYAVRKFCVVLFIRTYLSFTLNMWFFSCTEEGTV